jgi:putative phosphoribosyl transferase
MTWWETLQRQGVDRRFHDRAAAGRALAAQLVAQVEGPVPLILALPRGGVPVAFVVAQALDLPLDLLLVRKLGVPGHEELAMGAIAEGGVQLLNDEVVRTLHITPTTIAAAAARERQELERRARVYRGDRRPPDLQGRTLILIDDGLATGTTMRAAIAAARAQRPASIIAAVPVADRSVVAALGAEVDRLIVIEIVDDLGAIGLWYHNFTQVSDEEVCGLLRQAERLRSAGREGVGGAGSPRNPTR